MKCLKEWYDATDNKWVMEFEVDDQELAGIQRIEQETGMSFSALVNLFFSWLVNKPADATEAVKRWMMEDSHG